MKNTTSSSHILSDQSHQSDSPPKAQTDIKKAFIAITKSVEKILSNLFIRSYEPIISEHSDRNGEHYYRLYNPVDEEIYYFASEDEVRIWLEQSYH